MNAARSHLSPEISQAKPSHSSIALSTHSQHASATKSSVKASPEEILLKKQIEAQKKRMAAIKDPKERKAEMAKLADLEMKKAIAEEARRKFIG